MRDKPGEIGAVVIRAGSRPARGEANRVLQDLCGGCARDRMARSASLGTAVSAQSVVDRFALSRYRRAMAKFNTKTSAKKSAKPAKKLRATPPGDSAPSDFAAGLRRVNDALAALPPLTDVQRNGFEAQFSTERCDKAGVRTKAAQVFREGAAWVPIIQKTLASEPEAIRRYQSSRFIWFLECLRTLATTIEAQKMGLGSVQEAKKRAERALSTAQATRNELLHVLEILAGDNEAEKATLAKARGTATTPDNLAASLKTLATLAAGWITHNDRVMKAMAESVNLIKADVDKARRDAEELIAAMSDGSASGKREMRDSPQVNLIEGRVLLEKQLVMGIFEAANKHNKRVPKLVPGAGSRPFLARNRADGPAGTEQGPSAAADPKGYTAEGS
jgi:hypothetical protein